MARSPRWSSRASASSALLPPKLVKHHKERAFLRVAAVVAAAGCLALALAPHAAIVAVIPLGVVLLGACRCSWS